MLVHSRHIVLVQGTLVSCFSKLIIQNIHTLASTDLRYLSPAEAGPKPVSDLAAVLKVLGRMAWVYTDMHSCFSRCRDRVTRPAPRQSPGA